MEKNPIHKRKLGTSQGVVIKEQQHISSGHHMDTHKLFVVSTVPLDTASPRERESSLYRNPRSKCYSGHAGTSEENWVSQLLDSQANLPKAWISKVFFLLLFSTLCTGARKLLLVQFIWWVTFWNFL